MRIESAGIVLIAILVILAGAYLFGFPYDLIVLVLTFLVPYYFLKRKEKVKTKRANS